MNKWYILFKVIYKWNTNSLSNFEGEREVVPAFLRRQLGVVERIRQEVVQQRAERQPVRPARREVLQLHILKVSTN